MVRFEAVENLSSAISVWEPSYAAYAATLWDNNIRCTETLASCDKNDLAQVLAAGQQPNAGLLLHAGVLINRAKGGMQAAIPSSSSQGVASARDQGSSEEMVSWLRKLAESQSRLAKSQSELAKSQSELANVLKPPNIYEDAVKDLLDRRPLHTVGKKTD